jgi:uncharacterized protein (DUF2062 family)
MKRYVTILCIQLYGIILCLFQLLSENKVSKTESLKELKKEKKSFKTLLRKFLDLNDSPERIAMAFAIGVFIAFSPLLGTHLILVFLLILIFRLNKVAILTGALINNPWTIIPMYTAGTFLGFFLLGKPLSSVPAFSLSDFSSFNVFFSKFKIILFPYLLGCTILGLFAAILGYFLIKKVFSKKSAKKAQIHFPDPDSLNKKRQN